MDISSLSLVQKAKVQPSMYRVYKSTVQRVPVNIKSLSSHAAFLITLDGEKQVIAWIGFDCESTDSDLVRELGLGVMTKDYRIKETTEVPVILEGSEPVPLLEAVLEIFWSNSNTYFSKLTASERRQKLTNSSVSVGLIEKLSTGTEAYDFQETAFAHPDSRGTVPRVTFVPIELKTIAYVNVGEQWDIWISRGVTEEEERNVMIFLESAIASQISLGTTAFKKEVLSQYIQVARQGEERFLFRRPLKIFTDFEPPGKTAPRPERPKSSKGDKMSLLWKGDDGAAAADEEKKEEQKEEQKEDISGFDSSPTPVRGNFGSSGKAISFKNDVNFFDGPSSPQITEPVDIDEVDPHVYVDFNSVFAPGQEEQKASTDEFNPYANELLNDPAPMERNADGSQRVTPEMLQLVEKLNMSPAERSTLIKQAAAVPEMLVGYQIEIDEGIYAGLFVVTKTKKTLFKKSIYHLSAADGDEFWLRLQRGPGKTGTKFRPLRRVLKV